MRPIRALGEEVDRIGAGVVTWRTAAVFGLAALASGAFRGALAWRAVALGVGWSPGSWAASAAAEAAAITLAGLAVGEELDGGIRWGTTWKKILGAIGISMAVPGVASAAALAALAASPGIMEYSPSPVLLAVRAGPPVMRLALLLSDLGWLGGAVVATILLRRVAGPKYAAAGAVMLAGSNVLRLVILGIAGLI